MMDVHDETAELLERGLSLASVSGAGFDKLTEKQRRFAALYVLHQGNGTKAAELAGYVAPDVAAVRVRLNQHVAELINLLALADAKATLPVAIAVLVEIASGWHDPETGLFVKSTAPASERRKAALDLVKIAGAMPTSGPSVAVQVNAPQGNGANAAPSVVIQNVWSSRSQRLSGIAAPMRDRLAAPDGEPDDDGAGEGPGGVAD